MLKDPGWDIDPDWLRITSIDAHAAGEPLRVITGGFPELPGDTILAKRRYARQHYDHLRTALMWEPRGHADMYGCVPTEPVTSDGTLGVIFLHNAGFSTMCGHGIIGLAKVALDTGMLELEGNFPVIAMDTPAGRVTAQARREDGKVVEVSFLNVPSFVYASGQTIEVEGIGAVDYDIAFGGAFYAFVQAEQLGVRLTHEDFRQLIEIGMRIKHAITEQLPIEHPYEQDLSFLYGTIFIGAAHEPQHHSRNVCIFADGEVDRCPTGTGVSARAAIHYARHEMGVNQPFTVESILGTTFTGEIMDTVNYGGFQAVIPKITGTAHITGSNEWIFDPSDPLLNGFILR